MEPTQHIDRNEKIFMARQSCLAQLGERPMWEQAEQETKRKQMYSRDTFVERKNKGHLSFRIAICATFFFAICFSKEWLKENIEVQLIKEQITENWGIERMEETIETIMFQNDDENME